MLNIALAAVTAAALGRRSRSAGVATLVAALGLVYLRGYLVPGTPTLTRRYLPDRVLAAFGKRPDSVEQDVPEEMRRVAAARMERVSDDA